MSEPDYYAEPKNESFLSAKCIICGAFAGYPL